MNWTTCLKKLSPKSQKASDFFNSMWKPMTFVTPGFCDSLDWLFETGPKIAASNEMNEESASNATHKKERSNYPK